MEISVGDADEVLLAAALTKTKIKEGMIVTLDDVNSPIHSGSYTYPQACNIFVRCYSHSHKTVNTRENFWNVYCFATNQMRDETAKDNRQTAAWISHDLTQSNELALSSTTNLQFYCFQILKLFFLYFRFLISKE